MPDNRLGELPWLIDTVTGRPNGVRTQRNEEIAIPYVDPATGNLMANGAPVSGAVIISGLVANSTAAKAANLALWQAGLNQRGRVEIPGNLGPVYFAGELTFYSDTHLVIGKGTELRRQAVGAAGTATKIGKNANWNSTVFNVSGPLTGSYLSYPLVGWYRVTANISAGTITAGTAAQPAYIIVKGDRTGTYNGIYKVETATATTVTWLMVFAAGGMPSSDGQVTIAQADANITVEIQGSVSGGTDEGAYAAVDGLDRMGFIFNKVGNLQMPMVHMRNVEKYCIYPANVWRPKFGKLHFQADSAGLQFNSPSVGVEIESITGRSEDDMLAFAANDVGYTQYALNDANLGEYDDILIGSVDLDYGRTTAVALYPATGQMFRNVKIGRVVNRGRDGAGVVISSDTTLRGVLDDLTIDYIDANGSCVAMNYCTANSLTIGNVPQGRAGVPDREYSYTGTATSGSKAMTSLSSVVGLKRGTLVWGTGIPAGTFITSISGSTVNMNNAATAAASGSPATFYFKTFAGRRRPVIDASNGAKIGTAKISGDVTLSTDLWWLITVSGVTTWPSFDANYTNNGQTFRVVESTGTGSSGTILVTGTGAPSASGTLTRTSGTGDATITFGAQASQTNTAAVVTFQTGTDNGANSLDFSGLTCRESGDGNKSYSVLLQNTSNFVQSVQAADVVIQGLGNFADGPGGVGTKFKLVNTTLRDAQFLFGSIDNCTAIVAGLNVEGSLSGPSFNLYGTSKTYNLSITNVVDNNTSSQNLIGYGTTNTINLRASDGSVKLDGSKVTPSSGAIFYNTNAAYGVPGVGLYAMGASATTRIAA